MVTVGICGGDAQGQKLVHRGEDENARDVVQSIQNYTNSGSTHFGLMHLQCTGSPYGLFIAIISSVEKSMQVLYSIH